MAAAVPARAAFPPPPEDGGSSSHPCHPPATAIPPKRTLAGRNPLPSGVGRETPRRITPPKNRCTGKLRKGSGLVMAKALPSQLSGPEDGMGKSLVRGGRRSWKELLAQKENFNEHQKTIVAFCTQKRSQRTLDEWLVNHLPHTIAHMVFGFLSWPIVHFPFPASNLKEQSPWSMPRPKARKRGVASQAVEPERESSRSVSGRSRPARGERWGEGPAQGLGWVATEPANGIPHCRSPIAIRILISWHIPCCA